MALFRAWKAGDLAARGQLIEALLRIAATVARRYARRDDDFADFYGEASVGICNAVEKFDGTAGTLASLAFLEARDCVVDAIRRTYSVPHAVPIHMCVTEQIEEWKRAPEQEEATAFAELRELARKALTPPQFAVLLRRTADQELAEIGSELALSVPTVHREHRRGVSRLVEAVTDGESE